MKRSLIILATCLLVVGALAALWREASPERKVELTKKITLSSGEKTQVAILNDADEVRLFVEGIPFRENAHIRDLIDDVDGIALTKAQRVVFERTIYKYRPTADDIAARPACFIPHHFFRYYVDGKQVGELAVCFCCGGVSLNHDGPKAVLNEGEQLDVDYPALKKMLTAMNVPTDINCQGHALH